MTVPHPGTPRVHVDSRTAVSPPAGGSSGRVMERGRSKAYRPLPTEVRTAAVERGLAAYGRGAWYLAHEELEPAWMGTDDPVERAVLSGLIKLAAAYVHAARGNVLGVRTNLRGARERLRTAAASAGAAEGAPGAAGWVDLDVLLDDLEDDVADGKLVRGNFLLAAVLFDPTRLGGREFDERFDGGARALGGAGFDEFAGKHEKRDDPGGLVIAGRERREHGDTGMHGPRRDGPGA